MLFAKLFHHKEENTFLKNFIFGVEDSLVSTVGLLAGVASAQATAPTIIATGLVLIVVEGFSMGIGSFLTEETTEEMSGAVPNTFLALRGALTMLVSYVLAGLLPLAPYAFLTPTLAMTYSVCLSLFGLFILGFGTAKYYDRPYPYRNAIKMMFLGGLAVLAGVVIGKMFHL